MPEWSRRGRGRQASSQTARQTAEIEGAESAERSEAFDRFLLLKKKAKIFLAGKIEAFAAGSILTWPQGVVKESYREKAAIFEEFPIKGKRPRRREKPARPERNLLIMGRLL